MIKSKDEIFEEIKNKFAEDSTDETLSFLNDLTDTINDMAEKATGAEEWEQKCKDTEAAWRQKYKDRFFSGGEPAASPEPEPVPEKKNYKFEDLFKSE